MLPISLLETLLSCRLFLLVCFCLHWLFVFREAHLILLFFLLFLKFSEVGDAAEGAAPDTGAGIEQPKSQEPLWLQLHGLRPHGCCCSTLNGF